MICLAAVVLRASAQQSSYSYDLSGNTIAVVSGGGSSPVVEAQPQTGLFQTNGLVSFSVTASGAGLSYQWLSNGIPIAGATGDTLSLANLAASASGNFTVVIKNSSGSVTSSPAALWLDSKGVGMPDWWQMQYFGNLKQPPDGDYDGDGVDNLDEYLEGTNPTNPASYDPRLYVLPSSLGTVVASPALPYYTMGQTVTLTAIPDSGQQFLGWSGSVTGTLSTVPLIMNSNSTAIASFGLPLPVALDNTNLIWTTGGSAHWFGQTQISEDGFGAAQSGIIYGGEQSWLQAITTNLPQSFQLAFWWNVSSQSPDALSLSIDGVTDLSIAGPMAGWQQAVVTLASGTHTLVWSYINQSNDSPTGIPFSDSGWVNEVSLSPLIFSDPDVQSFTNSHGFASLFYNSTLGIFTNSDGFDPRAGLILSGNTLYGTASEGGNEGNGAVFRVNTDGSGFTNLYSFTAGSGSFPNITNTDGARPVAGLILSGNTLYGTTESGGRSGNGTVFALNTNGMGFTNLYSFTARSGPDSTNSDGAYPIAGLILSGNILYGTASEGGGSGAGTVFALNTNGTGFTTLYSFSGGSDGAYPVGGLILSADTLYGTAYDGGHSGNGTVFALNTNGTGFTVLYNFSGGDYDNALGAYTNSDGAGPEDELILSGDTLYGTASQGGISGDGTVFALSVDGSYFTSLHSFTARSGSNSTNSDGAYPPAGLILSGNALYGTASQGGALDYGTVFRVNIDGTKFTMLHTFAGYSGDGAYPIAGLILSGNTLYGTAESGGGSDNGTIFNLSLVPTSPPYLAIILSGANLILTWTNTVTGFTLQSTTNLFPAAWSTNSSVPSVINGQYTMTNPISGTAQFYRLSQ